MVHVLPISPAKRRGLRPAFPSVAAKRRTSSPLRIDGASSPTFIETQRSQDSLQVTGGWLIVNSKHETVSPVALILPTRTTTTTTTISIRFNPCVPLHNPITVLVPVPPSASHLPFLPAQKRAPAADLQAVDRKLTRAGGERAARAFPFPPSASIVATVADVRKCDEKEGVHMRNCRATTPSPVTRDS